MLTDIDRRVDSISALNSSLAATYARIADNMVPQRAALESDRYIESYGVLRSFERDVMHYASVDHDEVTKSSLVIKGTCWLLSSYGASKQ